MYIVKVQVLGAVYEVPVVTVTEAEKLISQIKKGGYRRHEGNAVIEYPPNRIVDVNYRKEE